MAKNQIQFTDNHQREIVKLLRDVGCRHGLWQAFRDFVAMGAIALSNAVDTRHRVEREAQYMTIVARYSKDDANALAKCFAHVVMGLEENTCDFLGTLFMGLELGDNWRGQFFTPYQICRLMAAVNMGDKPHQQIEQKGYIQIADPCVGGGAMLIAAAHTLRDNGVNYQQHMHAVGVDIDLTAVHMAYVQLSLLHVPAVIHHGNSISMEMWSEWRTPAHCLGLWDAKLRRAGDGATLSEYEPSREELAECGIGELVQVVPLAEGEVIAPGVAAAPPQRSVIPSAAVNVRAQLALF